MKYLQKLKENPIVALLIAASLIVGLTVENFFSWNNLGNLASNVSVRYLVALGVSGCLITKGTDLSAGRQVGLAACIAGVLSQRADYASRLLPNLPEMNLFVILLIVLVIGAVIGSVNGILIAKFRLSPFIATLGTQTIIYGICLTATNSQPIGGFRKAYTQLVNGRIGSGTGFYIPYLVFAALFCGVLIWVVYNKTTHGKYMYAIGGNELAARVSGVNTEKTTILVYLAAGLLYALAGYLLAAKSGGAAASMGQGYELEAIAGCTIGGVSTSGGIGTVQGILVGVLVFEVLKIILQFLNVDPYLNFVAQGLVIIIAVAIDVRKNGRRRKIV